MPIVSTDETDVTVTFAPEQLVTVSPGPSNPVVVAAPSVVNTVSDSTETVLVEELGIVGPSGPQGPQGLPGTGFPTSYSLMSVSSFNRVHNLGYYPDVRLTDADGEGVEIGVEYPDLNTVHIDFPQPFTGTVTLS